MKSKQELEEYFSYCENSLTFLVWAKTIYTGDYSNKINVYKGDKAGSWSGGINGGGSYITSLNSKRMKVHRIIYQLHFNDLEDSDHIDHIDGNPRNNSIKNLRKVDRSTNMRNRKMCTSNKSGVTGVKYYERAGRSPYWTAECNIGNNVKMRKQFCVKKYGYEEAKEMAISERERMMELAGDYSETHGKRLK